jgi:predicted SAM-dependent methyltransferase
LRFERLPLVGRLYTRNARRVPANVEYGDIVRGLPVAAASARAVYASHVLEHLALEDLRAALQKTRELLQPGAVFRLVVPDLKALARRYVASTEPLAAMDFMRATSLGSERRPRKLTDYVRSLVGNSAHLWMWDYEALHEELTRAGFEQIRSCTYGDWSDPAFADVEQPDRLGDAIAIESRRPI